MTKLFIGAVSKNTVDTVIEYANDNNVKLGLIPSRRQIDYDSGYVNNWITNEFAVYVKRRMKNYNVDPRLSMRDEYIKKFNRCKAENSFSAMAELFQNVVTRYLDCPPD